MRTRSTSGERRSPGPLRPPPACLPSRPPTRPHARPHSRMHARMPGALLAQGRRALGVPRPRRPGAGKRRVPVQNAPPPAPLLLSASLTSAAPAARRDRHNAPANLTRLLAPLPGPLPLLSPHLGWPLCPAAPPAPRPSAQAHAACLVRLFAPPASAGSSATRGAEPHHPQSSSAPILAHARQRTRFDRHPGVCKRDMARDCCRRNARARATRAGPVRRAPGSLAGDR